MCVLCWVGACRADGRLLVLDVRDIAGGKLRWSRSGVQPGSPLPLGKNKVEAQVFSNVGWLFGERLPCCVCIGSSACWLEAF